MDPPQQTPTATVAAATTAPAATDSVNSSPRSKNTTESWDDSYQTLSGTTPAPKLRLMCSFGGHIVPRPHDKSLCYIGGDTRIVVVDRQASLSELNQRLSKTLINSKPYNFTLKYQLPSEDLDSLISVTTDEDLENMIEEYDRLNSNSTGKLSRLRLFLFPVKPESITSIGSLIENSVKSEDWFVNALNGTNSGELSNSSSVNCLLGLNDESLTGSNVKLATGGGGGGGVSKHQDVHSVPDSPMLDRNSSFGSASSAPSLGNLPPIRVKAPEDQQQKVGIEEQFSQMGVNGSGTQRSEDGSFVALSSPNAALKAAIPVPVGVPVAVNSGQVVGDYSGRVLSDDQRLEHAEAGYRRQLQQQAQLMASQMHQKSGASGGGGGRDLASPDSVSSEGSGITNPMSRQKHMMYQDPNIHYSSVQSRVSGNPVEQNISDQRIQMQQQYQESGYMVAAQFDPQRHPQIQQQQQQQQQPQFIQAGSQYIQHLPAGAVPMPSYYPVYSSQQPQHSNHPGLEQPYPVYYMPARQTQAYNMPAVQHMDYNEAAVSAPSTRPQTPLSASMVPPSAAMGPPSSGQYSIPRNAAAPNSEVPANLYRTANTAAGPVVQVPSGQPQPQYVGFSQIRHPQSIAQNSATPTSYAYEFADPSQAHMYYAQPPPQMAAQYQTLTSASSEAAAQLPADSIKQQVRTSQP